MASELEARLLEARDLLVEIRHELLRTDGGQSYVELPAVLQRASTLARASNAIRTINDAVEALNK